MISPISPQVVAPGGEGPEPEAWTVGAVSLTFALALFAGAGRFPRWSFDVAVAAGSGLVSTTDALSELANRRAFTNAIDLEHARAARTGRPISIVVLDLDHFKTVNDRFGHPAGDRALRHVAGILRSGCRAADVAARVGGEEFALLLPETDGPAALLIAERVRAAIASSTTPDGIRITASFGVTESDGSDPLVAADRALYRAKAAGRDRCVLADSKPT